jgi:hypothetical protein
MLDFLEEQPFELETSGIFAHHYDRQSDSLKTLFIFMQDIKANFGMLFREKSKRLHLLH